MSRFSFGVFLAPGASIRFSLTVTNIFNGSGDWGQRFAMAHPRNPGAELLSLTHGTILSPATGTVANWRSHWTTSAWTATRASER